MDQKTPLEPVAVVGAGLAGCLCAISLAKAGYNVTLIDKAPHIMTVSSKIPIHLHSGGLYINDLAAAKHCLHDSINFKKALPFAIVPHPTAFAVMTLDDNKLLPSGKTQLMEEAFTLYNRDIAVKILPLEQGKMYTEEAIKQLKVGNSLNELALKIYKAEKPEERKETKALPENSLVEYYQKAIEQKALELYIANIPKTEIPVEQVGSYKQKANEQQNQKWEKMKNGFKELQKEYSEAVSLNPSNKEFGEPNNYYRDYDSKQFALLHDTASTLKADPSLDNKEAWTQQLARISDPSQIVGVVMSSEVGLNMVRTAAGINLEIERLEKGERLPGEGKITLLTNANVIGIEQQPDSFALKIQQVGSSSETLSIPTSQVVNATGYRGKALDDKMGHPQDWTVDVKGAGVIQLNDETFSHTPSVFFTEAKGMAHLSCFNEHFAGINYTTLDVAGTYVDGGVITFDKTQSLEDNSRLAKLEESILSKPIDAPEFKARARNNVLGCARFMPPLAVEGKVTPVGFVAGSLGLLGKDKSARESKEVYISSKGYHAVNLAKGGGAVSASMSLVHEVVTETNRRAGSVLVKDPFPGGSKTPIPKEHIIPQSPAIETASIARTEKLGLPPNVGTGYTQHM